MFVSAIQKAQEFTWPVIISKRLHSGKVECGIAACVIVNREGWAITSAHVLEDWNKAASDKTQIDTHNDAVRRITENRQLSTRERSRRIRALRPNDNWITNFSYWWGRDEVRFIGETATINPSTDLALGRLEPFDPSWVTCYPTFKSSPNTELPIGASVCRLGFPFHDVQATYDAESDHFRLQEGTIPVPRFPNDGIHTRVAIFADETSGSTAKFLETSTPGLRGQSGGPIFDVTGAIWAIQSHTRHLPLGFSPEHLEGGRRIVEHQFLNVGLGSHVHEIVKMLNDKDIQFEQSPQ